MKNREIADIFENIADALEFKEENIFRLNAYRKAAKVLREYPEDVEVLWKENRLSEIPGVGKGIADHIIEYIKTGKIEKYREATSGIPAGLLELLKIPGVGPKTLAFVYKEKGVKTLDDLEKQIESDSLSDLPGMGEKKIYHIKKGIELYRAKKKEARISLGIALPIVDEITGYLEPAVEKISGCGSLRRMKETVGDVDILCTGENPGKVIKRFTGYPEKESVIESGETKAAIIVREHHLQVDLRVVEKDSYGAALQYFTGSKEHNIKLRGMAKDRGLKINEYGVFKGNKSIAGKTEEEVYKALDLPWIPPELREDRGEIEAAADGRLPQLIELNDVLGDFHVHSKYSDGIDEIETIAVEAIKRGYKFIAISDHSKTSKIANGMSEESLKRRNEEIDAVSEKYPKIKILKGVEVDILRNGQLDFMEETLEQLDVVLGAVHQGFDKNVTERMIKAMENRFLDIIVHPTGRLLSGRKGYDIDIDAVMDTAAKHGIGLEINAYFDRLDLNDVNVLNAKRRGVRFSIGTDAHNTGMFKYMALGVAVARRGWLEKKDVLNCYTWDKMPFRRKR